MFSVIAINFSFGGKMKTTNNHHPIATTIMTILTAIPEIAIAVNKPQTIVITLISSKGARCEHHSIKSNDRKLQLIISQLKSIRSRCNRF